MQDKIPDALIAAFERHYSLDWNDPAMRNERLAWHAAWSEATKPCLLQIQEPAAEEQAVWHAGLDEGRAQAAAPVVLPVPAIAEVMKLVELHRQEIIKVMDDEGSLVDVQSAQDAIEAKLRALLATATGLPAQATWLQPKDLESLQRFEETASDNQGHDIGKAAATRLAGFGCLQSHGFGVYSITDFGHFVLDDWEQARALPFRTQEERDADHRADIAAAKVSGETPTHYLVDEHYPAEASERGMQAAQGGEA